MTIEWEKPSQNDLPLDHLKAEVKVYQESITLTLHQDDHSEIRFITREKLAEIFSAEIVYQTNLLPADTLWCNTGANLAETALWRQPKVWDVSLQLQPFEPPLNMKLPMPGLIFVCRPGMPPQVYAAKKRPVSQQEIVYHAPLYNTFRDGNTCQGSHRYPPDIRTMPESFFEARFSIAGDIEGRSKKYPEDLLELWREIDGKKKFPKKDLVKLGTIEEIMDYRKKRNYI